MNPQHINGSARYVNDVLRQLFRGHGVEAEVQSDRVTFAAHPHLWADGALFRCSDRIVQVDVRLGGFDGDRVLTESIIGIGADINAQAKAAVERFANASFHVFLPAFFGRPPCHGTERENWTIGRPRIVYPSPITSMFGWPPPKPDGKPNLDFYPAFMKRLASCDLPPGTHWVRIYQMRQRGVAVANEVLLDNEPWQLIQSFMNEQPWPFAEKAYDVRVFLVVKDE